MAKVHAKRKACSVNPLKASAPLGAALAYLGVEGAVPLLHGAQGCTSFALVQLVKHYREAIPMQTTAINEVSAILGGRENLEQAISVISDRMKPRLIGIASTALVETRGEDFVGDLKPLLARSRSSDGPAIAFASTPEFEGALEEGWSKATSALIEALVRPMEPAGLAGRRVNVLPGVHLTSADLDEVRETIEAFGLEPLFLPDLSGSLDGHVPEAYIGTSLGGAPVPEIARMGQAIHTIAIGEQMRTPAQLLTDRTGVAATVLGSLTGLEACDRFVALLGQLSGRSAPASLRRRRSQLVDAVLDGHFALTGKRIAVAGDSDLVFALGSFVASMGAELAVAVASTDGSPLLAELPCAEVIVGDLDDFETAAKAARAELLVAGSHGGPIAERLSVPLYRAGFPILDRLGVSHRASVGYRGTRELLFELANQLLSARKHKAPAAIPEETPHAHAPLAAR